MELNLSGLEPYAYYSVQLSLVTSGKYRHCYDRSTKTWRKTPDILIDLNTPVTLHSDSPHSGIFWMSQPVSFRYVKLTKYEVKRNCRVREINSFFTFT